MRVLCSRTPRVVDSPLIESPSTLRFAVATFDTENDLRDALPEPAARRPSRRCVQLPRSGGNSGRRGVARRLACYGASYAPVSWPDSANQLYSRPAGRSPRGAAACRGSDASKAALGHWLIPGMRVRSRTPSSRARPCSGSNSSTAKTSRSLTAACLREFVLCRHPRPRRRIEACPGGRDPASVTNRYIFSHRG